MIAKCVIYCKWDAFGHKQGYFFTKFKQILTDGTLEK